MISPNAVNGVGVQNPTKKLQTSFENGLLLPLSSLCLMMTSTEFDSGREVSYSPIRYRMHAHSLHLSRRPFSSALCFASVTLFHMRCSYLHRRREGLGREEKSSQDRFERGHCTVIFLAVSRFSIDVCTCDKVWENLSQLFSPLTESARDHT